MKITIKNDSPLIKVNFNFENESLILYYKDSEVFHDYFDNSGTIARIFQSKHSLILDKDLIESARDFLNSAKTEEIFINYNIIKLFSEIFESGKYEVFTIDIDINKYNIVESNENWYPFKMDTIFLTQSIKELSQKTIEKYEKKLSNNFKPIILGLQYGFLQKNSLTETPLIILDGHHKFEAYRKKGISPKFLIFYREEIKN